MRDEQYYLGLALHEAKKGFLADEVPVGALIVKDGRVLSKAHNRVEGRQSSLCHAEVLAIQKAQKKLGSWRLIGATLYCTLEPCPMCAGAILLSRIDRVVYGARDHRWGAAGSVVNLFDQKRFNHFPKMDLVNTEQCGLVLAEFFRQKRNMNL